MDIRSCLADLGAAIAQSVVKVSDHVRSMFNVSTAETGNSSLFLPTTSKGQRTTFYLKTFGEQEEYFSDPPLCSGIQLCISQRGQRI
ncbi:hypothetical protein TNCV_3656171 [Trichonephila clavipes]|nr:hypothetical protein TNCV_3656171 [Trichonephila clavipes]